MSTPSPRILAFEWGEIEVDGLGKVKDAKLFPGGGHEWDWTQTGTQHSPGIQIADVEELISAGATVVVLSRGMERKLQVMDETVELLNSKGIVTHVLETTAAIRVYNNLAGSGAAVGALLHSTC